MVKVAEKTASLNYPNPHVKVDTYGSKYTGEQYQRDYINIENAKYGKIANRIHTGISKDGQYLVTMSLAKKVMDEDKVGFEFEDGNENEEDKSIIAGRRRCICDGSLYRRRQLVR